MQQDLPLNQTRVRLHHTRSPTELFVDGDVILSQEGTTVEPLYNGHHWEPKFCP